MPRLQNDLRRREFNTALALCSQPKLTTYKPHARAVRRPQRAAAATESNTSCCGSFATSSSKRGACPATPKHGPNTFSTFRS